MPACILTCVISALFVRQYVKTDLPAAVRELINQLEASEQRITYDNFEAISDISYATGQHSSTEGMSHCVSWKLADNYLLEVHVDEMESDGIIAIGVFRQASGDEYKTPALVWDWKKWPDRGSPYDIFKQ